MKYHVDTWEQLSMICAVPYLKSRFFELYVDEARAREVLAAWMDSRSGR